MNQEELKQRLIELLKEADKRCDDTKQCENCVGFGHGADCINYLIADHLIANSVTILENEESIANGTIISAKNIKFNTGDFARIVGNECDHHFALGAIVQLEKHETDYRATDVNGCQWWVVDDELEPADVADWEGVKDE